MFYDVNDFSFLRPFLERSALLSEEFRKQAGTPLLHNFMHATQAEIHSHVDYWIKEGGFAEEQIGYDARDGSWSSFPVYKKGFPIKWYKAEETFPLLSSMLQDVPGLNFSALFRIAPQSGSKEHTHQQKNLIFHLCLCAPEGESVILCDGEKKVLSRRGDHVLFDYSRPHSSFNYGTKDRINLVIDFSFPT
jgi:hypothetical protein